MYFPPKDEVDEYNKEKSEAERWLTDFAKFIIGLSGAALSFTIGAILTSPSNTLLAKSRLLKASWTLLGVSVFFSCVFLGVVVASTFVYLENKRAFMHKESSQVPEYPRWNERARNTTAALSIACFASGFLLMGIALLSAIAT